MPEVPRAGEGHGHVPFVRRRNDFRVAYRTARLNRRRCARFRRRNQAVREREKSIAANHAAFQRKPASPAFHTAMRLESTRLIWPAPVPSVRPSPT